MTFDEIQALREKHFSNDFGYCQECFGVSARNEFFNIPYPCDTIKVLDAWEAERTMNVAPLINAYLKTNVYTNLYTNEDYDL